MSQNVQLIDRLKRKFWWWTLFTVAVYFMMRWVSGGLSGSAIVALEMAKTQEKATLLLAGVDSVSFLRSTYVDFVFIVGYVVMLYVGSRWLGHLSGQYILRKAGGFFSVLVVVAGLADVLENMGLIHTLTQGVDAWVVHSTYDMAVIKFSLLFIDLLFCGISVLFMLIERLQHKS